MADVSKPSSNYLSLFSLQLPALRATGGSGLCGALCWSATRIEDAAGQIGCAWLTEALRQNRRRRVLLTYCPRSPLPDGRVDFARPASRNDVFGFAMTVAISRQGSSCRRAP